MMHWTEQALKAHQERIGKGAGRIIRGRDNVGEGDMPKPAKAPKRRSKGEEALELAPWQRARRLGYLSTALTHRGAGGLISRSWRPNC